MEEERRRVPGIRVPEEEFMEEESPRNENKGLEIIRSRRRRRTVEMAKRSPRG